MFLSKLKDLSPFKSDQPLLDLNALEDSLSQGLFSRLQKSFLAAQSNPGNSDYSEEDVKKIIDAYAQKNMVLAAASSLVPGPLGILGSIPELLMNFGNQMFMIYDLGCAHDKENFLNKDLLLDIPLSAFGGNTDLSALQDQAEDLLDAPQQVLLTKANELGKSVIERTLKKSVVQFVPVAGPLMMSIWSKSTTNKIAKISNSFFDQKDSYQEHFKPEETEEVKSQLQVQKIKALANLIESNNEINEAQIEFIGPIIENANIPQDLKNHLIEESMRTGSNFQLDHDLIKTYEEDENLISELVIMAKRGDDVDGMEREYILKESRNLGVEVEFAEELMA